MNRHLEELVGCVVVIAIMLAVFLVAGLILRRRDGRWPGQDTPEA